MAKNSGATTFIIFVAIVGLVLGGLILAAPPKTEQGATDTSSQNPTQVLEDPNLINRNDAPIIGAKDAKVKIAVFTDYLCSYCVKLHESLNSILSNYSTDVSIEIRHFIVHPEAQIMAQAAYAANLQGKFKEANDLIFAKYQEGTEDNMVKMAQELKLNVDKFKTDMTSESAKNHVDKDSSDAQSLGLGGTPSVFVNNKYLEDSSTLEENIKTTLGK